MTFIFITIIMFIIPGSKRLRHLEHQQFQPCRNIRRPSSLMIMRILLDHPAKGLLYTQDVNILNEQILD